MINYSYICLEESGSDLWRIILTITGTVPGGVTGTIMSMRTGTTTFTLTDTATPMRTGTTTFTLTDTATPMRTDTITFTGTAATSGFCSFPLSSSRRS